MGRHSEIGAETKKVYKVIFVENFERFVGPEFSENQKMVLVNGNQYPKSYLWSIVY